MAGIRIGVSCSRSSGSPHTVSIREWELAKPEVDCLSVCCYIRKAHPESKAPSTRQRFPMKTVKFLSSLETGILKGCKLANKVNFRFDATDGEAIQVGDLDKR